jgi:N-glycosylase/DNA lyase
MKLENVPFNLDATLCCGQVFRWSKIGSWWYGIAKNKIVKIRQIDAELEFSNVNEEFVKDYFGLKDNLHAISTEIGKDDHIRRAIKQFWGLRIIRQDPWECLISYICATYKNIPAINRMLLEISRKFGEPTTLDDMKVFTFPTPKQLAEAPCGDLKDCGLGYRAEYVQETSKRIFEDNFELDQIRQLPYERAKKALCTFPGVGPKVADCVLLFSMGKLEAFPVDRWVKRVIVNHYARYLSEALTDKLAVAEGLSNSEYAELNAFARRYFGEYAGYAQEYLYHYERLKT